MINIPKITEVSIDLSTICQLRCVECSTSKGITHNGIVGKGQFSLSQFVDFIKINSLNLTFHILKIETKFTAQR